MVWLGYTLIFKTIIVREKFTIYIDQYRLNHVCTLLLYSRIAEPSKRKSYANKIVYTIV